MYIVGNKRNRKAETGSDQRTVAKFHLQKQQKFDAMRMIDESLMFFLLFFASRTASELHRVEFCSHFLAALAAGLPALFFAAVGTRPAKTLAPERSQSLGARYLIALCAGIVSFAPVMGLRPLRSATCL